jgi:hypothetical protein
VATNIIEQISYIRCAFFSPNCTWSPNYSVLVILASDKFPLVECHPFQVPQEEKAQLDSREQRVLAAKGEREGFLDNWAGLEKRERLDGLEIWD